MFRFEKIISAGTFLIIDSSIPVKEMVKFIRENNIENIYFNSELGYDFNNITPYLDLVKTKKLAVAGGIENLKGIEKFKDLEYFLCSSDYSNNIDLSFFQNLKELRITWFDNLQNIEALKSLGHLHIGKYKGNLSVFENLPSLKELELPESYTIKDLDFLNNLSLKKFSLSYGRRLESIDGLKGTTNSLRELELRNCKKINSWEVLSCMTNLKKLQIYACADLPDITFISNLKKLDFFSFVDTKVVDGNLHELEKIDYVGFVDKRYYSHKNIKGKAIKK